MPDGLLIICVSLPAPIILPRNFRPGMNLNHKASLWKQQNAAQKFFSFTVGLRLRRTNEKSTIRFCCFSLDCQDRPVQVPLDVLTREITVLGSYL